LQVVIRIDDGWEGFGFAPDWAHKKLADAFVQAPTNDVPLPPPRFIPIRRVPRQPFCAFRFACGASPGQQDHAITSQSCHILFEETVKNEGDETLGIVWGHHPAFGKPFLSEECSIDLPVGATGLTYQTDFSGNSPFECNLEFVWPMAPDKEGHLVVLSRPMPPERRTAFNIYIRNFREGWYAVTNPTLELGIGMK
jgi:hypothetical protein